MGLLPVGAASLNPAVAPARSLKTSPDGWKGTPLNALLGDLPAGEYALQVRALDAAGNTGLWSEPPLSLTWDGTAPAQVQGVRVSVSVSVTVGQ